ncbi:3-phosphoshikimate 1-carboxyvinyltransferase [Desulfuribacillus alkaliarsenatis]|uniref:3-phosphoshikimate 1-carboxyvinyltransferase n=1 Tax=Desulfuribacillus alkaliarsenatis TaxID=766136 RepID=A0A1E5G6C0_9FIRM|nr:3-phosphoshikimate 1-carboxyvinyltransferase [Desulfuribacillus alkaliarsenatis]OEF98721.1 3-phosphoshikimate 1-carboxyvinyltransferase [Desulfuribacillus alkaliarsenatis]
MKKPNTFSFFPAKKLQGETEVPGDKSISHRAIIFGSIAEGTTKIENFLPGLDCLSTIDCFRRLGVNITAKSNTSIIVNGVGLQGLNEPTDILDVGNSGTTIRLLSGLLSGTNFYSVMTGDASIRKRPMDRVKKPLEQMGARIHGRDNGRLAPLSIIGTKLTPIHYQSPVASAQIKSSILLAGIWAEGHIKVTEPTKSRDHTELMYKTFGGDIEVEGNTVTIAGGSTRLSAQEVQVPGDISSAAFLMVAASIVPNSEVLIKNVGVNPTRSGIIDALQAMNANIKLTNERKYGEEPVADILVTSSHLKGTIIEGNLIPRLIDEVPILLIAAALAEGDTIVKDAKELRVKETDRIQVMHDELLKVGIISTPKEDGIEIAGNQMISGGTIDSHHDHRIGMAFAVAALTAKDKIEIENYDAVKVSFPNFTEVMTALGAKCE